VTDADAGFGPYLVGPLLGRGGMGEVHRAVDSSQDGRPVALKRLAPHLSTDTAYRERFRRECETAARLDDPHVLPIHRYGEIDGRLFLDMQLVDGRDLAAELTHTGPMPAARAVGIVAQVASALDAAHAVGLVHRDVKPSNVLLTAPGPGRPDFAQLTDFGIAAGTAAASGVDGTVEYLAPERLLGHPSDRRADVYALACVLYELLTGLRAFPGTDFAAQVHGHLYLPPPRPAEVFGGLPPGLDVVVARGMAKDPAQRHQWAGALAEEAIGALGRPGAATALRTTSRRRLLLGAAGAVVLAGGGALAVTMSRPGAQLPGPLAGPLTGPPPEPVIEERVLGVRSTSPFPFTTTQVGGRPAILVHATKGGAQLHDLVADREIGLPVPGYEVDVNAAEIVAVDGREVLVTAPAGKLAVIDLQTGNTVPVSTHESMDSFTAASAAGRSIAATVGYTDGIIRRWDLSSRSLLEEHTLPDAVGTGPDLGTAMLDGRFCLVAQMVGRKVTHVWDAVTGEPVVRANATGELTVLDGAPVLVSATDRIEVIDLHTGAVARRHDTGGDGFRARAVALVDGRPVVATEGERGTIVVRDVDTGRQLGAPMTGHEAALTALGVADLNGRPILVSAARDNAIRVWDLAVRAAG
jgi:serine/threonine-protein kinase